MKFIRDLGIMSNRPLERFANQTYHQFLQVVLQRRTREKQSPSGLVSQESLVPLRLKVLENMTFVEHARLPGKIQNHSIYVNYQAALLTSHGMCLKNLRSMSSPWARLYVVTRTSQPESSRHRCLSRSSVRNTARCSFPA